MKGSSCTRARVLEDQPLNTRLPALQQLVGPSSFSPHHLALAPISILPAPSATATSLPAFLHTQPPSNPHPSFPILVWFSALMSPLQAITHRLPGVIREPLIALIGKVSGSSSGRRGWGDEGGQTRTRRVER